MFHLGCFLPLCRQAAVENKLLQGKLESLETFRENKEKLEAELRQKEELIEKLKGEFDEKLYNLEKKAVLDKDRWGRKCEWAGRKVGGWVNVVEMENGCGVKSFEYVCNTSSRNFNISVHAQVVRLQMQLEQQHCNTEYVSFSLSFTPLSS